MLKGFSFVFILTAIIITGCDYKGSDTTAIQEPAPTGIPVLPDLNAQQASASGAGVANAGQLNPEHGQPGHRCDIGVGEPLATPIQTTGKVTETTPNVALNPEHGKPGHRCDLGVGVPLDSKPVTTAATTQSQPTVINTAATKTAAGMNPAHGMPGHRCDIAVGAPLNSKPAAQPTATVSQPMPVFPPIQDTSALVKTEPGMNPPHGQPGHRCDILVGAPLDSTAAKKQ